MRANAQRDGRLCSTPQRLADARPLVECHAVMLPKAKPVEICWGASNSPTDLSC